VRAALSAATLWQLVEARAETTPGRRMLLEENGREMSFSQYRDTCEVAAAGLAEMGVACGHTVSWELPTGVASAVLAGALARIGAVQNPLVPSCRRREVSFATNKANSRLLVVPSAWRGFDYLEMAREVAAEVPGLRVAPGDRLPSGDPSMLAPPPLAPDAVRWVFFTSGTTGEPKGAKHTDATIQACARGMSEALALSESDLNPLVFPFAHIGGVAWLFCSLMTGCQQLLVEAFEPEQTIPLMARHGVTLAGPVTSAHLAYLAAQRRQPGRRILPSVRAFPGGAAPKPPELHYELKRELGGAGIVSGYGLTECPILSMNRVDAPDDKLANTEGLPTPGVHVRVVDALGRDRRPGEEGELRVKGPQMFKGYLDPVQDEDAIDERGFLRTGDLGYLDEDGHVVVTGRLKDVIVRKGESISAKELEDVLYAHPKVADVAVLGLPDSSRGELVCAVVSPADRANPLTFAEMSAFLRGEGLMVQKIPERLELLESLPRNPSGKVLKQELRERFAAGRSQRSAAARSARPQLVGAAEAAELTRQPVRWEGLGPWGRPALAVDLRGAAGLGQVVPSHLPAVTIGVGGEGELDERCLGAFDVLLTAEPAPAPWVTVADPLGTELESLVRNVEDRPLSSLALVQLLRLTESLDMGDGLVAESAVYSTLQSGPEFARWLASRPPPRERSERRHPLKVERSGGILTVTLDRPEVRNAYNRAMRDALAEALELVLADPDVSKVVLEAAGSDFCSGGDLDEFGTLPDPATAHAVRTTRSVAYLLAACSERVTARVKGACVGAGVELSSFARRVSARPGSFFLLPEQAMGLVPGAGGTVSIPRRIGRQRTAYLALSGRRLVAEDALAWGLVDELA
jgi:cyclohexanecarboxylate-CoA ligase